MRSAQSGIALVLALWLTVLLTVLASGFAFSMRTEALAVRNAVSLAQVRAIADGAVERTAFELMRPQVANVWKLDGQPHRFVDGEATVVVTAVDEAAKIDINSAPDPFLKSLLMVIGGLDDAAAGGLVDAIDDWRDPDDLRRPNGAELPEYRGANLKYGPANAPFETDWRGGARAGHDCGRITTGSRRRSPSIPTSRASIPPPPGAACCSPCRTQPLRV